MPLLFKPVKACGLVTSCIKCLSIYNTEGPSSMVLTTCLSQIFSNNVLPITYFLNIFLPAFVFHGIGCCDAPFIVLFAASSLFPFSQGEGTVLHCKSKLHNYHINFISILNI